MNGTPITVILPRNHSAPAQARALLREHADGMDRDRLDTAVLLISELVTNAVLHGTGEIRLTIDIAGDGARFSVCDEGGGTPVVSPEPGPDGGWGLRLVGELATRWGVREGRTHVWFEL